MSSYTLSPNVEEARQGLDRLCRIVNDKPRPWMPAPGVRRFKELVVAWRAASSLEEMLDDYGMDQDLKRYIHADYRPSATNHGAELELRTGRPLHMNGRVTPDQLMLELFADLITNPLREKFAGPCARPQCGQYFVKRRSNQLYCESKCNKAHTAGNATWERNDRNRKLKIKFAKVAKREYMQLCHRTAESWQIWVAKRATELMRENPYTRSLDAMTRNFVTLNLKSKYRKKRGDVDL
jgi:hypothetical protein